MRQLPSTRLPSRWAKILTILVTQATQTGPWMSKRLSSALLTSSHLQKKRYYSVKGKLLLSRSSPPARLSGLFGRRKNWLLNSFKRAWKQSLHCWNSRKLSRWISRCQSYECLKKRLPKLSKNSTERLKSAKLICPKVKAVKQKHSLSTLFKRWVRTSTAN